MRTLTVNFNIVTSAPGDENLSAVIADTLKRMAESPTLLDGSYESGQEFMYIFTRPARKDVLTFQAIEPHDQLQGVLVDIPEQTFVATVTATAAYENSYALPTQTLAITDDEKRYVIVQNRLFIIAVAIVAVALVIVNYFL